MAHGSDYQEYQRALQFDERISRMAALQSLTQFVIDELNPREGDNVLDVGTGTGRLASILCTIVLKGLIVGIDRGYGMLRVASERISRCRMANFYLVQGKAETLPFRREVFDSACLMLSFHHFTEPERAIAEINRVLIPKGCLVSLDPVLEEVADEEEKRLNELIEEAFQSAHGPEFRFFTTSELRGLYETAGFSIDTCQIYAFPFRQRRIEAIPMGPHWLQAYELLRSRQEEGLINRFEQNYFSFRKREGRLLVNGKMNWAVIRAIKC